MNIYYRFFIHVIVPIFIGIMIYAFWRGLYLIDSQENIFPLFIPNQIPEWIKYNLPDALWLYALLTALFYVWREEISQSIILWLFISVLLTYSTEVLQAFHLLSGTFDWKDLLAYSISIALFCFFNFSPFKSHILYKLIITKT